jgi:acyl-CoA synthetase (NDP forming)
MEAARQIIAESGKPLLLLKSGRTREGASAAVSHTGSLAGSDEVCDAAFRQAGIIRCDTVEDMFNYALALAYQPLPEGRKIAIITNAGGPGVLATDRAVQEGLALARFSEETVSVLKKSLPHTANLQNPVDLIGDAKKDRYGAAVTAVLADRGVDGALIILTPQSMTDIRSIAEEICSIEWRFEKPVYASFMGQADVAEGVEILQRRHIPHYRLPEDMCQAFARAYRFDRIHRRALCKTDVHQDVEADSAEEVLQEAVQEGVERDTEQLSMTAAFDLLEAYRLPILPYRMAASRDQAAAFSEELGFPVVLKIFCREIIHKSDIGGVALNLSSRQEVIRGYDRIVENLRRWNPDAEAEGVLVQRAAAPGEELIVGVRRDPSFGPIVLVGLGGIYAEIFRDVSMRVSPIDEKEGGRMVEELRAFPLLNGARGRPRRDIDSLLHVILQVDRLAQEHREICELDINPLIVGFEGGGCVVADVRIMIESLERRNV